MQAPERVGRTSKDSDTLLLLFVSLFESSRDKALHRPVLQIFIASLILFAPLALQAQTNDPWRDTNERIFAFNDFFDRILVRPVATTYTTFVPRFARQGIGNFFSNLNDINVFVNDLLQLKFDAALSDSGRFAINTTLGIVGFIDVASDLGLQKNEEDFGQTLGYWGVESGPYVVLPVFGSSNVRDSFGLVLDTLFNPIQYHDEAEVRLSLFVLQEIDTRASLLSLDELVSGDRYLFFREAYVQRRDYLVADGQVEDEFGGF
ncbi:MAG: VacJ family lipoprotein [Pseudomonadales bacterium]|nr:VacJ family lipoprotein [Pseudomonadales bacterium]